MNDADVKTTAGAEARHQQHLYLAALHETTLGLMNRLDLNELLDTIVGRAPKLVGASFGWLYLYDPDTDTMEARFGTGDIQPYIGVRLRRGEGLAGQIWQQGEPMAVEDYQTWAERSQQFPQVAVRSAMGVPLKSEGQTIGVLGVSQSDDTRAFGAVEIEALTRFAQLAVIALDNARLYAAARRQAQELALLDRVRTALAREVELPALFRTVVEAIVETFGYTQVSLYLVQDDMLRLQYQVGYTAVLDRIPLTRGVSGRVVRTAQPIRLEDVRSDPDFLGAIPDITSEICIPLIDNDQVVGTLNIESVSGVKLTQADLRLMEALASHINVALGRARLYVEARQSELQYRQVLENVQEVIFQVDTGGAWAFLNPAWTRITGFELADSLGQRIAKFIHPDDRDQQRKLLATMWQDPGEGCQCELRCLTKDGGHRWLAINGQPLWGADGHVVGLSGVMNDVTEQRRIAQEMEIHRDLALTVINTIGQGLMIADADSKLTFANPALAHMLGYQAETLKGHPVGDFVLPEDQHLLQWARQRHQQGATSSAKLRLRRADGSVLHAMITGTPRVSGGQNIGAIAVITDLTDIRRTEEELAQARDQALQASRLKSEFLAAVSHEIRAPLNSIVGMNKSLLKSTLTSEQHQCAATIQESSEALLTILDDILDFSKIEAGELQLAAEDFQPAEVLAQAMDLFQGKAKEKGIAISVWLAPDVPNWLHGDPGRLRQIWINLLSNAVKFTDSGRVDVRMLVMQRSEMQVMLRCEVCDTGRGISPAALPRLFAPFALADGATTGTHNGVGLGLPLSKKLVEMMKGDIGGANNPKGGATFWFTAQFALPTSHNGPVSKLDSLVAELTRRSTELSPKSTAQAAQPMRGLAPHNFTYLSAARGLW